MSRVEVDSNSHMKSVRRKIPPAGDIKHSDSVECGSTDFELYEQCLNWDGKSENTSYDVDSVSIQEHERIDPKTIIDSIQEGSIESRISLFHAVNMEHPEGKKSNVYYSHKSKWTNRLIAGDNLQIMNSLLEKEQMGGKVQTTYIDPPYGRIHKSNFQPNICNTNV